jgi:hypothetical protein
MNYQLLKKVTKISHLLNVFLFVTNLKQQELWILFGVYFLVEDLNFVS